MADTSLIGMHKTEVDTPALLLDIEVAERNIERMAKFFEDRKCNLRPHCKTHKSPLIAKKQIEAGAIGITCATIEEAELMAREGIKNILIANQIIGKTKINRLVNLLSYLDIIVCVDNDENAKQISKIAGKLGKKMNVLVEINVGLNRCGIKPGKSAVDFVRKITNLDNIIFRGIMGYEGGLFTNNMKEKKKKCQSANQLLVSTKELIEKNRINVEIVSAGGSNTYNLTGLHPGITEVQVGSYVTMDIHNKEFGLDFEQAVFVISTVISRTEKNRAVIDAGLKAVSSDNGLPLCTQEGLTLFKLNEEHGHIKIDDLESNLSVGDRVELIPAHGCTTIPLYGHYFIIRHEYVESVGKIKTH